MTVRILPVARVELIEAFDRYERIQDGLGWRFWSEVDEHIAWISQHPAIPHLRDGG